MNRFARNSAGSNQRRKVSAVGADRRRRPLRLEQLEDRCLLTGIAVLVEDSVPGGGINPNANIGGGTLGSYPSGLTDINGTLYFSAESGSDGKELWRIVRAGLAEKVEDAVAGGGIRPGSAGSNPTALANINGTLYFRANDGTNGYELWRINGAGVAEMVEDAVAGGGIRPGSTGSLSNLAYLTDVNGTLYFVANGGTNGNELWRINSAGVAQMVEDAVAGGGIRPGSNNSDPQTLTNVNGTLYFSANDGTNGYELWRINSSGVAQMVEDGVAGGGIRPGSGHSYPRFLTNVNGTLYFNALDGTNGYELWRINSSGAAQMVENSVPGGGIAAGSNSSFAQSLLNVNGTLYFKATDVTSGYEVWRINSAGVAEMVEDALPGGGINPSFASFPANLTDVNGTLYFSADDGTNGYEVWRVNSAGRAEMVEDAVAGGGINPGVGHSSPFYLANVNGTLYFSATDGTNGRELWGINTSGVAEMVEDSVPSGGIRPGAASSFPFNLTDVNGALYFRANDGTNGLELWRITDAGVAELVEDAVAGGGIAPGYLGSVPSSLTMVNGRLYFSAVGGSLDDYELWFINSPPDAVADTATTPPETPVTISVLANDIDAESDPLTVTQVGQLVGGTAVINGDNTVTFTPTAGFTGAASFNYTASDGVATDTATVTITVATQTNTPPDANSDTASTAFNMPVTVSVLANDTDADGNPLTVTAVSDLVGGTAVINGDNTVTFTPAPGFSGAASFTYTISDGNGGDDTATVSVTVAPSALHVTNFTPTGTGFVAQFSLPLTTSELNLYDQGGLFGAADVTVVGATVGTVRGSLIVNATADQVTFVKTGAALVNDTYTVTLRSATNGIHDGTNLLDGNADGTTGDDYVTTFSQNVVGTPVVATIPDFARGYGQAVNVWNSATNSAFDGIPVLLSTGVGVRSATFTVNFNPALLTIDNVTLGATVAAGTTLNFTNPTPGTINVTVSNATTDLGGANLNLVNLKQTTGAPAVPNTAQYGAKHVLDISGITVTGPGGASLTSVANDGVHIVAYPGDLNGSQTYNAPDTSFMQQFVLNSATFGLAAYQLADPTIVADINGNGLVQGNDTAQVQRLILNQPTPFVPNRPTGLPNPGVGLDPKLLITTSVPSAAPGETFTMTLSMLVTEAGGITFGGVEAGITYDPALFTVTSFSAGDWTTGDGFSSQADFSTPGVITFAASTLSNYLAKDFNSQGAILTATLMVNDGAAAISTSINLTDDVTGVPTALYDGTPLRNNLLINPAVTDGFDAGVDASFAIAAGTGSNGVLVGDSGQDILSGGAGNDLLWGSVASSGNSGVAFDAAESSDDHRFSDATDVVYENAADDIAIDNALALAELWTTRSGVRLDEPRLGAVDEFAVDTAYGDWYLTYQATGDRFMLSSERNLPNRIRDL